MANNVYIGMRYVPLFDGAWDATKSYEALTIVEYGNNSYTSKKPVPAGTLPTNTTYWALTGNYNGQIANINTRLDTNENNIEQLAEDVSALPTKRKFVLIGDSFACGIRGGNLSWVDGWIDYFANKFPNDTYYYDPAGDTSFAGTSAFTTTSQKNFIGELNYIYANKLGDTEPTEITDIFVLGGTNELSGAGESGIANAIDTFCTRARQIFPNANITIGAFGLDARGMAAKSVYSGYSIGAKRNGCGFANELFNLGTKKEYDSGYGHFSEAGYNYYNPIIMQRIISGKCNFAWYEVINLTLASTVTIAGTITFALVIQVTNTGTYLRCIDSARYRGWYVINNTGSLPGGTFDLTAFNLPYYIYTAFPSGLSFDNSAIYFDVNTWTIAGEAHMVIRPTSSGGTIAFTAFPWRGLSAQHAAFAWNGTVLTKVEVDSSEL